jgi:hypothetical protein
VAVAGREGPERHLEDTADHRLEMMNGAGKAIRPQSFPRLRHLPFRHGRRPLVRRPATAVAGQVLG